MKVVDYKQSNSNDTMFIKHKSEVVATLIMYVDDIVLTCDNVDEMNA